HVKPGGRYRCHPIGVLEVDRVDQVTLGEVTEQDARRAGFTGRAELAAYAGELAPNGARADLPLYRIELHHAGDGDRVPEALEKDLTPEQIQDLARRLERLDRDAPWTRRTMRLILRRPRIAASKL